MFGARGGDALGRRNEGARKPLVLSPGWGPACSTDLTWPTLSRAGAASAPEIPPRTGRRCLGAARHAQAAPARQDPSPRLPALASLVGRDGQPAVRAAS